MVLHYFYVAFSWSFLPLLSCQQRLKTNRLWADTLVSICRSAIGRININRSLMLVCYYWFVHSIASSKFLSCYVSWHNDMPTWVFLCPPDNRSKAHSGPLVSKIHTWHRHDDIGKRHFWQSFTGRRITLRARGHPSSRPTSITQPSSHSSTPRALAEATALVTATVRDRWPVVVNIIIRFALPASIHSVNKHYTKMASSSYS